MTVFVLQPNSSSAAPCVAIIAGSIAPFAPSAPFSQNGSMSVGNPIGGTNTTTTYNVTNNTLSDVYVPMSIETKDLSSTHRGQPDHVPETIPYEAISGPKMGSDSFMERMDRPDGDRDNPNPRSRLFGNRIDVPGEILDHNVGGRKLGKREIGSTSAPVQVEEMCASFEKTIDLLMYGEKGVMSSPVKCARWRWDLERFLEESATEDLNQFKDKCKVLLEKLEAELLKICNSSQRIDCTTFMYYIDKLKEGTFSAYHYFDMAKCGAELCITLRSDAIRASRGIRPCTECIPGDYKSTIMVLWILFVSLAVIVGCLGWNKCRRRRQ